MAMVSTNVVGCNVNSIFPCVFSTAGTASALCISPSKPELPINIIIETDADTLLDIKLSADVRYADSSDTSLLNKLPYPYESVESDC